MKKNKVIWTGLMLLLAVICISCDNSDDIVSTRNSSAVQKLYAVARQSPDAILQYKAEMPLFTLDDIRSYNPETGKMAFNSVKFDTHLFYDSSCKYRVYFYAGNDLLFDALAVSWLSSAAYWDQLTFQCDFYGPSDETDASKSHYYLRYGYPGIIDGDESLKQLMLKNAPAIDRFISILRSEGKIIGD